MTITNKHFPADKEIAEKQILIVDDNARYRLALKRKLSLHGYEKVQLADSPEKALDILNEKKQDVILLDIYMAGEEEKTGIELLRILRKRGNRDFIVMVSGDDTPETVVEALRCGADDFWLKGPYLDVAEEIARLFRRPRTLMSGELMPLEVLSLGYIRSLNLSSTEMEILKTRVDEMESGAPFESWGRFGSGSGSKGPVARLIGIFEQLMARG